MKVISSHLGLTLCKKAKKHISKMLNLTYKLNIINIVVFPLSSILGKILYFLANDMNTSHNATQEMAKSTNIYGNTFSPPLEWYWSVTGPLYCRLTQSPGFKKQTLRNILHSHKSQLMQHGWKTVISHGAFFFLDRFVWEDFTTG